MIRFVYPNVNASEEFVGCGRYTTFEPGESGLPDAYSIAEPNVGHLSKVTTAASLLAKESFESERDVYEYKDRPDTPYLGDSMGLAYLLALIHRSRRTCWEERGQSFDVWCTGTIEVAGGMPILHNVYRNLFTVKLQAFLDEAKAPLFIVPIANIEAMQRRLCRQRKVSILSLEQYLHASEQKLSDTKTILQVHGDELPLLIQHIFISPVEKPVKKSKPRDSMKPEDAEAPVELEVGLRELQSGLLRFSKHDLRDDKGMVELDKLAMRLFDLLDAFPGHFERLYELISAYQNYAEELTNSLSESEYRRVLAARQQELDRRVEELSGGEGRSFLNPTPADSPEDSPYALCRLDFDELETDAGIKKILSKDELQESEGIDWIFNSGLAEMEKRLMRIAASKQLEQVLSVLWKRFPRIFLYYSDSFWSLAAFMHEHEPLKWTLRFYALKTLLTRSLTAEHASELFEKFVRNDRHILSAFLVLHPKKACRLLALSLLPPDGRWDLLLCSKLPWLIVKDLVETSCRDTSAAYVKALFLLLRSRMMGVNSPLAIAEAYRILNSFYHVPLFLEESFFKALIQLHKNIDSQAHHFPLTQELAREMQQTFRAFCAREQLRDADITEMRHIPLPIQRKLAHDGYLPRFFICNVRDVIALETVPYVEHRQDAVKFFRLRRINSRALEKLASNKYLMREHQNRSAFCYNPKANSVLLRTYLSTLTRRELKDISRNRNVSAYARELAGKYLSRYA